MNIKKINLKSIRIDGGTQSRVSINEDAVASYAEAMTEGATLPPVVVFRDGADDWLADGFHRYHAHNRIGAVSIEADIRAGTLRDAVLYSVGANGKHGMPPSNADKRKAVLVLLNDAEWSAWSDREIAKLCHVSHQMVCNHRPSLSTVDSEKPAERTYTTKHGTEATMDTSGQKDAAAKKKAATKPEPAAEPVADPELDGLRESVTVLADANDRLTDRLAVVAMEATEGERTAAAVLIAELRAENRILSVENDAIKASRDGLLVENAALKRQCESLLRKVKRAEQTA